MCGIAGFVGDSRSRESVVQSMLSALERRGPDAKGLHSWPEACFGHRRLAILDLSPAGSQPMLSSDGSIGVVFNGCIYNFLEIRHELEQLGHSFRSQCDTEVLVEGYREWGIDALVSRLRGMFAFAIWDDPRQTLTLVRDRLGVKPLAYSAGPKSIGFASTIEALRRGGLAGPVDPEAVLEVLDVGFVTERRAIYSGIRKLQPATILEWRGGEIRERIYWTLPESDDSMRITLEEAAEEAERLLIESVRLRLISDVPVGALLSGGIDSALVCLALSKLHADIQAFTVGTPGDPEDETEAASAVAARLGIRHSVVSLAEGQLPDLDELGEAYSEPFGSPSALGMLRVSHAVKPHATVLLTGDGGDDIFPGYEFFYNAWKAQQVAEFVPGSSAAIWRSLRPRVRGIGALRRASNFFDYAMGGVGEYARVRIGIPWFVERGIFGDRLRGMDVAHRQIPASFESARRLLSDVLAFHHRMHFLSEFMTKVDGGTMFYSLEARSPLLDQKLWEFAARIPFAVHFQGGQYKAVLREIVRKRIGPDVAFRKKQGFTIPVEKWLASAWSGQLREMQHDSMLVSEGWMERKPLAAAIDEALRRNEIPKQLWYAFALEHWLRHHRVHAPAEQLAGTAG
jgi:asparagine synthase (glutamine-hydrolysing)